MSIEGKVGIVVDSGSSVRNGDSDILVIPLELTFREEGRDIPYLDTDIPTEEFYRKMAKSTVLPKTSGAITGRAKQKYLMLGASGINEIISIHITSAHSAAFRSAELAKNLAKDQMPNLDIRVIDSRTLSAGTWFMAEKALAMSRGGSTIDEIEKKLIGDAPKIRLMALLDSFKNLKAGGRVPAVVGGMGDYLNIKPVLGIINEEGKISRLGQARTWERGVALMINKFYEIANAGPIARVALLHTNNLSGALEFRRNLANMWSEEIPIYDAGSVLGAHLGAGTIGFATMYR